MAAATLTPEEKIKGYIKIFYVLVVVTVLEVAVVMLPLPRILMDTLVVVLSCGKAAVVGYYYMHLNHETKWLRIVACSPLFMFIYAVTLIPDSAKRPISDYIEQPPRVFLHPHTGKNPSQSGSSGEADARSTSEQHAEPQSAAGGALMQESPKETSTPAQEPAKPDASNEFR